MCITLSIGVLAPWQCQFHGTIYTGATNSFKPICSKMITFYLLIATAVAPHVLEAAEMDHLQARSLGIQVTVCGKSTGTWMSSPSLRRTSIRSTMRFLGGHL